MDKEYYSIDNIVRTKAQYQLLLGQRSNGKSYSAKYLVLWEAYYGCDYVEWIENHKMVPKVRSLFGYMRRLDKDLKTTAIEDYFVDAPVSEITEGNYDCVKYFQGKLYFGRTDDEGKVERCKEIGRPYSLHSSKDYKSRNYKEIGNLVFEEFITDEGYLPDEPRKLMELVSTIARDSDIRVILIGNTVSQNCPYVYEWGLKNVYKQKIGTIELYKQHRYDTALEQEFITTVAVEYCANVGSTSSMYIGKTAEMITSAVWETDEYPRLDGEFTDYDNLYTIYYKYQYHQFKIHLMREKENSRNLFVLVTSGTRGKQKCRRIVTDEYSTDKLTTKRLTRLTRYDSIVLYLIDNGKICFTDNLTGTNFNQLKKDRGGL